MGQRSSSGVNNLPRRPSQSPSLRGSTQGGSNPSSPAPSTPSSNHKTTSVRTSLKNSVTRKSILNKSKSPADLSIKNSPSTFSDRVLQKTSTISPAPASNLRRRNGSQLPRFGFKGRPSSLLSGESTDSVNSILSDVQTNSSDSNLFEENGNLVSENCRNNSKSESLDNRISGSQRSSSPCTISEASSGVTSSALSCGRITAQTKQLPEPQTAAVKVVKGKTTKPHISPQLTAFVPKRNSPAVPNLVMPKQSVSRIPQTKSSLLKSQKTLRDFDLSNKSVNTLDSGLGSSSSSESDKVKGKDDLKKVKSREDLQGKGKTKFELDISDEWLKEKRMPLSENKAPNRNSFRSDSSEKLPPKDQFKDTTITYGVARQKFAPYSRNRIPYQSFSVNPKTPVSKVNLSPAKFSSTGIVKNRIDLIEKTPSPRSPDTRRSPPKKLPVRPTTLEKTPIVSPSTTESVELSRTVCRRLEYNEGKGLGLSPKEASPTAQDILMIASYEVKKVLSPLSGEETKREKDLSESEKSPKLSPNESEASFEILDSPESPPKSGDGSLGGKVPSPPKMELVIRESGEEEEVVPSLTLMRSTMTSSTCSTRTLTDGAMDTPRDSCERSTGGNRTPPNSHRGEMDFLIDDEISDQPGLTFDDDLNDSLFEDEDLFANDLPPQSPPLFDLLPSPIHVSTKTCAGRSRHESQDTVSSIGDDLMLDFETDDQKSSLGPPKTLSCSKTRVRRRRSGISIPGPRYEEQVSSPAASLIYDEWTSMLAQVRDQSPCVSDEPVVGVSPLSCSIPNGTISTQPSNGLDLHNRPRTLSADLETKKGVLFKPPRQGTTTAEAERSFNVDRTNFHYICQDVTAMKTLLFKLRRVLQVADTVNPFDLKSSNYLNLGAMDGSCPDECEPSDATQENADLKRQVVLLQQRLEEKDRSIHILQQQLAQALHANHSSKMSRSLDCGQAPNTSPLLPLEATANAATQTDRSSHRPSTSFSSTSMTTSEEDGLGPTVSSERVPRPLLTPLPPKDLSPLVS